MKNILFILDRYYPTDHAFLERVYSDLIHDYQYQVYFVMRSPLNRKFCEVRKWNRSVVITFKLPDWDKMITRWWLNLRILCVCIGLSSRIRPEILQVRNWIFGSYIAMFIRKIFHKSFIYQYSFPFHLISQENMKNGDFITKIRTVLLPMWQKRIFRQADMVFAISKYMKDQLVALGIDKIKIYPVGLGIDTRLMNHHITKYHQNNQLDKNYILYFGAMDKRRNLEFLLDVWKIVLSKHKSVKLYMVGGRLDDIDRLRNYAIERTIENSIIFTGKISRYRIPEFIENCMFTVSPIPPIPLYNVSSPTKLYESLGFGKPVVGSNTPEQKTVLSESGGGISVKYDKDKFANTILYLLNNNEIVNSMGRKGKNYVLQKRTYEHITSMINDIYTVA